MTRILTRCVPCVETRFLDTTTDSSPARAARLVRYLLRFHRGAFGNAWHGGFFCNVLQCLSIAYWHATSPTSKLVRPALGLQYDEVEDDGNLNDRRLEGAQSGAFGWIARSWKEQHSGNIRNKLSPWPHWQEETTRGRLNWQSFRAVSFFLLSLNHNFIKLKNVTRNSNLIIAGVSNICSLTVHSVYKCPENKAT